MVFGNLLRNKNVNEEKDVFKYGNLDEKEINKMLDLVHAAQ